MSPATDTENEASATADAREQSANSRQGSPDSAKPFTKEALHAALASGERPPQAGPLAASAAFGWRGILKVKHVPEQLVDVTITPVLFTLMFTFLFGGAIAGSTTDYLQYILPGILVMSVLFTTVYAGTTLNTDMTKGVVDRIRTLPIWRPSPLVGALVGDSVRMTVAASVVVVLGLILGFRPDGGATGVLAAIGLVVVFAFGLSWAFATLGLIMRSPNAVMNTGFSLLFPITFLSNAFVDPETMPSALRAFVDANPVSHLITAARDLMHGSPVGSELFVVLGTAAVLTAIFAPLTARLYNSRG